MRYRKGHTVAVLCERSEVGHLKERTRTLEVRRPKFEGPEELTLRAEEVGSLKACINVDHIAEDRWGPPLVDADWHAFCQAIYKGIEGEDWVELYEHYKEMSRAAGVRRLELWEEHFKDPIVALDKALKCVGNPYHC